MGGMSIGHWLIVLVIVLVLFGAKKIPDLATGMGKGIKNFKNALKEDEEAPKASNSEATKIDHGTHDHTSTTQETHKA
jgi:sec-independent protein translocase protein TatA